MDIVSAFALVIGVGLIIMAVAAWRGRLDLFPDSIRLNHTGVLASAGVFCFTSGSINLYTQVVGIDLGPSLAIVFACWLGLAGISIYMYLVTPPRLMSRMSFVSHRNHLPDLSDQDPFDMDSFDLTVESEPETIEELELQAKHPLNEMKDEPFSLSSEKVDQVFVVNRNIEDLAALDDEKIAGLIKKIAPEYRLDVLEPFKPCAVGWSLISEITDLPDLKNILPGLKDQQKVLEGSVWWDWNMQHLGDFQRVWIVLDAEFDDGDEVPVAFYATTRKGVELIKEGAGPYVLYCEPGTHKHASSEESITKFKEEIVSICNNPTINKDAILSGVPGCDEITVDKEAIESHLKTLAFNPTFNLSDSLSLRDVQATSLEELEKWIPKRLKQIHSSLPQ